MQLLKITNIPIEYKLEVEPARLEMKQAQNAEQRVTRESARLDLHSRDIQVRLDTTELRASLNLRNPGDFARYYGDQGRQDAYQAIGDAVQTGNQMQQIQDGVTIAQIVQQKLMDQPTTYQTFLPSAPTDLSWQPGMLEKDYQAGSMELDWQIMRNLMEYVPGKFNMNILQYPKVQIEYLGDPNYVPPSANPNYEGENA